MTYIAFAGTHRFHELRPIVADAYRNAVRRAVGYGFGIVTSCEPGAARAAAVTALAAGGHAKLVLRPGARDQSWFRRLALDHADHITEITAAAHVTAVETFRPCAGIGRSRAVLGRDKAVVQASLAVIVVIRRSGARSGARGTTAPVLHFARARGKPVAVLPGDDAGVLIDRLAARSIAPAEETLCAR